MNLYVWALGQIAMTIALTVAAIFVLSDLAALLALLVSYLVATFAFAEVTKPWA